MLNTWWEGDPAERYWMEITKRDADDVGENLMAPQFDGAGRTQWSYELVSQVQPGDRVLHYRTDAAGGPAIVGWSEAIDVPSEGIITWQAHGTRGRARGVATTGPSWYVPLSGLTELDPWVRLADLNLREPEIVQLRLDLEAKHGAPIYFPFFRYRAGELRAQQGYLVKVPVEFIHRIPGLAEVKIGSPPGGEPSSRPDEATETDEEGNVVEDAAPPMRKARKGQLTRIRDPKLKKAIEDRALQVAKKFYEGEGATDIVFLGKPYDIKLTLEGEERHVEVKGSSVEIKTVELTRNEVLHADDFQPTDLVVVDKIEWTRTPTGDYATSGGRLRRWTGWSPDPLDLVVRTYAYNLPAPDAPN